MNPSCLPDIPTLTVAVSDPSHARYGHHLTAEEVQELIRPRSASIDLVYTWLAEFNLFSASNITTSPGGDWLYLSVPVQILERLLQTEYFVFCCAEDATTVIRTLEWSVPAYLAEHVEFIEPTNVFLRPQAQFRLGAPPPAWELENRVPTYAELVDEDLLDRGPLETPAEDQLPANPTAQDACNRLAISPLCLRVLYGTVDYQPQAPDVNGVGVVNFLGEVSNRSDIQLYLERYRPDAAAAHAAETFEVRIVNGGDDQQTPDTPQQLKEKKGYEGALDAQTVLGISWPTSMITYNVGGHPPFRPLKVQENTNEPYLAWLQYMQTQEKVPSVITISYAEDEKTVPAAYARRVCAEFAQLGARGVSVLVASGDWGVGKNDQCVDLDETRKRFMPSFPASCPYVTAVGATRFLEPEMVAFDARSNYSSGGGFSDVFAQPVYQKQAVDRYLEGLGDEFGGWYNPSGRAFPDVSAMGYHFSVLWNGTAHLQDGTSASTPTVAAIIALVNDALVAAKRPPLGFLNPWIYSEGHQAFRDVTVGSNLGCNTSGFPAREGWDPATGFGTPVRRTVSFIRRVILTSPYSGSPN